MFEVGYIKLFRKLLSWEWYQDANTARLFIHLLLTVSIKDDRWMGIEVPKGARIASINTLSTELKMSTKQIRTALDKLISTNEVARTKHPRTTVLSIVRWEDYQTEGQGRGKVKQREIKKNGKQHGNQNDTEGASKAATSKNAEVTYNTSLSEPQEIQQGKQLGKQRASETASNRALEGQTEGQQYKNIKNNKEEKKEKGACAPACETVPLCGDGPPPKGTPEYDRWRNQ